MDTGVEKTGGPIQVLQILNKSDLSLTITIDSNLYNQKLQILMFKNLTVLSLMNRPSDSLAPALCHLLACYLT